MIRRPNLLCSALIAGSFDREADLFQGSGLVWARSRFALQRRTGKKEEALGLKRLPHSLTVASAAAVIALAATNAVRAADKETLDPAQNSAGRGPILLVQIAAFRGAKGSETANVNVDSKGVILNGYDAVAFFKQRKPVKGNSGIESTYQGATYLFASTADKADFDKDPAKYAPQYGGFCAYGVVNGILTDIEGNPDAFAVYKGKLYLCGNQAALRIFRSNIDSNIEKADTNWRQLTGS
jgi:YHS domain-containing protein